MKLGQTLKTVMVSQNLDVNRLARKAGMTRQGVVNIFNDAGTPTLASVEALCKALSIKTSAVIALAEEAESK